MQKLVIAESVEGKFGPQVKDVAGNYYSFSKFYKGPTEFPVGTALDVDVYTTAKGGKYLNSAKVVVGDSDVIELPTTKKTQTTETVSKVAPKAKPDFKAKADTTMSKDEWKAKDRSQLIGGLSHDSAAITAALVNVSNLNQEKALEVYKKLLEGMLAIREEVK